MDASLDYPAFFPPFVPFFDARICQPSTPLEAYLRLRFYRIPFEGVGELRLTAQKESALTDQSVAHKRPGRRKPRCQRPITCNQSNKLEINLQDRTGARCFARPVWTGLAVPGMRRYVWDSFSAVKCEVSPNGRFES